MDQWIQTISILLGIIISTIAIWAGIKRTLHSQYKAIIDRQTKLNNQSSFMMKMLFEIIDILDGKKINGQVKKLRKEAEQFNIDN